ncbi:MAG: hypothetical protein KGI56_01220 [Acidobacteriota bacterium]|nr:hypothetical protein [Acidobacteriota bacterium]
MTRLWTGLLLIVALLGCSERPQRIVNANLGIIATFPGEPRLHRHTDPGPFGTMEWFDLAMSPPGRMDESFSVSVGNLPPGNQGGTTDQEILDTFQNWLAYRLGPLTRTDLPAAQGPGFRYRVNLASGDVAEGIVIYRAGRIHHAQAITSRAGDPRTRAFLDGFVVTTR